MTTPDKINLVIVGAGGHGAEVCSYLADLQLAGWSINLLGIVDEGKPAGPWEGTRIIGGFDDLGRLAAAQAIAIHYIVAVGNNALRRQLALRAEAVGPLFPWKLRYPTAHVGPSNEIGPGTLVAPGAIVTTRTRIGKHCILNIKSSVSHDCVVGDYANINPGATVAGNVRIGQGAFIGAGATLINGVDVGEWTIVGAGAVVVRNIPPHVTAVGVPARVIKNHQLAK